MAQIDDREAESDGEAGDLGRDDVGSDEDEIDFDQHDIEPGQEQTKAKKKKQHLTSTSRRTLRKRSWRLTRKKNRSLTSKNRRVQRKTGWTSTRKS